MSCKQNISIFFGVTFMLVFALSGMLITRDITTPLIVQSCGVEWFIYLRFIQIPVTILLGIGAVFLTRKGKINRAFHVFLPISILFSLLMIAFFYFNQLTLYSAKDLAPILFNKIVILTYYLWVGFSNAFIIVLIWGFANQNYTFKRAAYQYPLIAIFASLSFGIYLRYLVQFIMDEKHFYLVHLTSAIFYSLIYIIYFMLREVHVRKKDVDKKSSWKYLTALIVIVFFITLAKHFCQIPFKDFVRLKYNQATDYIIFMGKFSFYHTFYQIAVLFFGVFLGLWMYIKGSKLLAKIGGALIIVIAILGFYVFAMPMKMDLLDIEKFYTLLPYSLLISLLTLFLYLIKELCYFRFPLKNRFSAKIVVDLIFVSIASSIYLNVPNYVKKGMISKSLLMALFLVSMAISFVALFWINKEQKINLKE